MSRKAVGRARRRVRESSVELIDVPRDIEDVFEQSVIEIVPAKRLRGAGVKY